MIPPDIVVEDLGENNWGRMTSLVAELLARDEDRAPNHKGPLLVVYNGLRLLKAVDLGSGMPVDVDFQGVSRLDALARTTGFASVVAIKEDALSRVFSHAQREVRYDDDLVSQAATFLRGFSAEWRKTIFTFPPGPRRIRVPRYAVMDYAARAMIPDGSVILIAVTENGRAWASTVVGYRGGEFWLLSSLDATGPEEADLADCALREAVDGLALHHGGTVRAIVVERECISRIARSRFAAGSLLWGINTSELRLLNVPWRWKLAAMAVALLRRSGA